MAIALEATVTGGQGDGGGDSFTLTSWTPGSNELVLVAVALRDESITVSCSGNGLTFVQVRDVDNTQGQCGITLFRAMGASPSIGQITVTVTGNIDPASAIASRFSGVDTSGTNGSGAVEADTGDVGPDPDNDDMKISITTLTNNAWAFACGTHRLATFTVPGDETGISINQSYGTGGGETTCSTWYDLRATAGATILGADNDLSTVTDWCCIAASIKPAAGTTTSTTTTASTSSSSSTSISSTSSSVSTTTTVSTSTSTSISSTSSSTTTSQSTSSSTSTSVTTTSSSTTTSQSTSSSTSTSITVTTSTSTTVTTSTSVTISTSTTTTLVPATELSSIAIPIPRGLMFIEQVKFTEPYSLQLIGGDDQRLETFLAQRGIRDEDDLSGSLPFHPKERPIVTPFPPEIRPPPGARPPPGFPPGGGPGVLYPCGQIPLGGIIMWSGTVADIPECYALCDGAPPTPDLRNKFVVGATVDEATLNLYQVGDEGGSDEIDVSHTHAAGTLVADNESAHTHGIGTYAAANESSHTHGDGSYAAANDTHDHNDTFAIANDTHNHNDTFSIDNDAHTHDVTGTSAIETLHIHGSQSYNADAPTGGTSHNVAAGADFTVVSWATFSSHTQGVSGLSSTGSDHTHGDGSYAAASDTHNHGISGLVSNDTHNHSITGSVSNDTHNHDVTGTSGAGSAHTHSLSGTSAAGSAHGHTISGSTASGLTTFDNRPQFFALAYIMRIT